MSFNTFGHMFRVTTFGESHGIAIGCVVDGCPPLIPLTNEDIQHDLDRRRPGQSRFTTQRQEPDAVKILSGRDGASGDRRAGDDGNADCAADREHRPALQGLFRDQGQVSPGACRLHLRGQIRPARLSRRRAFLGARDRHARRRRRHRAQDIARCKGPRRAGADGPAQDRSRQLGLGRDRAQSVLLSGQGQGRVLRAISRWHPQERLVDRRRD